MGNEIWGINLYMGTGVNDVEGRGCEYRGPTVGACSKNTNNPRLAATLPVKTGIKARTRNIYIIPRKKFVFWQTFCSSPIFKLISCLFSIQNLVVELELLLSPDSCVLNTAASPLDSCVLNTCGFAAV